MEVIPGRARTMMRSVRTRKKMRQAWSTLRKRLERKWDLIQAEQSEFFLPRLVSDAG
jgi:hypothetical protein